MPRKFIYKAAVLFGLLFQYPLSFAKTYELPIYEADIAAHGRIETNYKFDPNHQYIICWENSGSVQLKLIWAFKHQTKEIFIPVALKANEEIEGEWADMQGKLIVSNEFNDKSVRVNCIYALETWERLRM